MAWVVNKIFPFAILLHLWMAVIFYRDVCLEQIGALGPASGCGSTFSPSFATRARSARR